MALTLVVTAALTGAAVSPSSRGGQASAAAAPVCPSQDASLTVHLLPGDTTQTVTADDLLPDQTVNADYLERGSTNQTTPNDQQVVCGVPISSLLSDVGLGPSTVNFVGIEHVQERPGSWSTLTHADVFDPSSTYAGGLVPVIRFEGDPANGYATTYLRPLTNDPDDVNLPDQVVTAPDQGLDVYVGNGSLLSVTATASPAAPAAGQQITFTAGSTPATSGTVYHWDFGPGLQPETGASVTYAFPAAGVYDVSVTATSPDGSAGTLPSPLAVTVGKVAPHPPTTSPSVPPTGTRAPSLPQPGTTRTPSAAPTARPTTSATPTSARPAGGLVAQPSASPAARSSAPPPVTIRLAGDGRPLVSGRLIGGPLDSSGGGASVSQPASAAGGADTTSRRWIVGSAAALAIMLLFAAGARRELRGSSRPRRSVGRAE